MRLTEYENIIKNKVQKNNHDETIYEDLQKMIYTFLQRKKACRSSRDYEDVSYIIAGDLFMMISNNKEISCYLGYLEKIYLRYVLAYYKENTSEEVISFEDAELEKTLIYLGSSDDYNYIDNKLYLSDIVKVIDKVLKYSCKYSPNHLASLNLQLSLVLSLLKENTIIYHLTPDQGFYLEMVVTNFYSNIWADLLEN